MCQVNDESVVVKVKHSPGARFAITSYHFLLKD